MIRLATINDLDSAYKVIEDAKKVFKENGSNQWQDYDGYPSLKTLSDDLKRNELFVYELDNKIIGVMVISSKHEEAYDYIYDGKWLSDDLNYVVLHRIAVLKEYRGLGYSKKMMEYVINYAKVNNYSSIKVDTMVNNKEMRNLLVKSGFILVGKINLLRKDVIDKLRLAYDFLVK